VYAHAFVHKRLHLGLFEFVGASNVVVLPFDVPDLESVRIEIYLPYRANEADGIGRDRFFTLGHDCACASPRVDIEGERPAGHGFSKDVDLLDADLARWRKMPDSSKRDVARRGIVGVSRKRPEGLIVGDDVAGCGDRAAIVETARRVGLPSSPAANPMYRLPAATPAKSMSRAAGTLIAVEKPPNCFASRVT
jgi:hypothetical protein